MHVKNKNIPLYLKIIRNDIWKQAIQGLKINLRWLFFKGHILTPPHPAPYYTFLTPKDTQYRFFNWSLTQININLHRCRNNHFYWCWSYWCLAFPSFICLTVNSNSHVTTVGLTTNLIGPFSVNWGKGFSQFQSQGVTEGSRNVGISQLHH